jgi:N6-adenosine-specific RNA methylase IME4
MTALLRYDAACRALAEARTVDEAKEIHDKAEAMRVYARQAQNLDLEIQASEIRVRAERRLGEMLIVEKQAGHITRGQPKKKRSDEEQYQRVKLDDIGIDRKLSSRAQRLGGIAERAFEAMVARMREQIRERGSRASIAALNTEEKTDRRNTRERDLGEKIQALPEKKYGVILADPEWRFEPWSRETGMDRAADNHYPTSCTEVIASRDVASIAADDCVLFLWATVPMLPQALLVMGAWGFDYKSNFVWVKDRLGTGYWNRNQHELLLIGTRGSPPAPAPGTRERSVITCAAAEHSAKPEVVLEYIEGWYPTLPKIELNRRGGAREGWNAWGNESVASA